MPAQVKNFLAKECLAEANPVETFEMLAGVMKEADDMYHSNDADFNFMFLKDLLWFQQLSKGAWKKSMAIWCCTATSGVKHVEKIAPSQSFAVTGSCSHLPQTGFFWLWTQQPNCRGAWTQTFLWIGLNEFTCHGKESKPDWIEFQPFRHSSYSFHTFHWLLRHSAVAMPLLDAVDSLSELGAKKWAHVIPCLWFYSNIFEVINAYVYSSFLIYLWHLWFVPVVTWIWCQLPKKVSRILNSSYQFFYPQPQPTACQSCCLATPRPPSASEEASEASLGSTFNLVVFTMNHDRYQSYQNLLNPLARGLCECTNRGLCHSWHGSQMRFAWIFSCIFGIFPESNFQDFPKFIFWWYWNLLPLGTEKAKGWLPIATKGEDHHQAYNFAEFWHNQHLPQDKAAPCIVVLHIV